MWRTVWLSAAMHKSDPLADLTKPLPFRVSRRLIWIRSEGQSMEANGNHCVRPTVKDVINYRFYSMLKPTLFALRFLGGPTGLWRFQKCRASPGHYRRVFAILMLLAYNLGALSNLYYNIISMARMETSFKDNINSFYVLAISSCGTLCLDTLWLKRNQLKQLLRVIDFEPKCCPIIDAEVKRKNEREIRRMTIKLSIMMVLFTTYVNYVYITLTIDVNSQQSLMKNQCQRGFIIFLLVFNFLSIYPFTIILSFYISFSWIFRLKICRVIQYVRQSIDEQSENGVIPDPSHVKMIAVWFTSYMTQFKTFNAVFKPIAGFIYIVMVWSVMALSQQTLSDILGKSVNDWDKSSLAHEMTSVLILLYFLYSISSVDYCSKKLIKLLYRQSLAIKFESTNTFCHNLSEKVYNFNWISKLMSCFRVSDATVGRNDAQEWTQSLGIRFNAYLQRTYNNDNQCPHNLQFHGLRVVRSPQEWHSLPDCRTHSQFNQLLISVL